MIDVFLSRPTWVPREFEEGLEGFLNLMKNLELNPRSLGTTDYPNKSPLDEVINLLDECKGVVILGLPQITVASGVIKEKTVASPLLLATEWNHIEAGLAYAKRLPLLVIHHIGISRGIFDRGAINSFIYEVDLSRTNWATSSTVTGAIRTWKANLLPVADLGTVGGQLEDRTDPYCPNCSDRIRKFYLSPIPPEFQKLENATYECTKCGYKK